MHGYGMGMGKKADGYGWGWGKGRMGMGGDADKNFQLLTPLSAPLVIGHLFYVSHGWSDIYTC